MQFNNYLSATAEPNIGIWHVMTSINPLTTVISTAVDHADLDHHPTFQYVANAPFLTALRLRFKRAALRVLTQSPCPKIGESYGEESREVSSGFGGRDLRFGG